LSAPASFISQLIRHRSLESASWLFALATTMRLALLELSAAQNNPARGSLQLGRKGGEKFKDQKAVLSAGAFPTRNLKTSGQNGSYSG
jgi:hypothetical protein